MKEMIDIHSHILPGVDDGAKDMEQSLAMAKQYLENGINTVVATPHYIEDSYNKEKDHNEEVLDELREELEKRDIDLRIYLGNEVYLSPKTIDDIEEGRVATLNGSHYVLLELPMYDIPIYFQDIIYALQLKGYKAIIAHPERNSKIMEDPNILYDYIKNGCLAQINLASLEGSYGSRIEETAKILLEHKMIHFFGTDAHSDGSRSPRLSKGFERLKTLVGEESYERIVRVNPDLLLKDEDIEIDEPLKYEKRKWYHFFRR